MGVGQACKYKYSEEANSTTGGEPPVVYESEYRDDPHPYRDNSLRRFRDEQSRRSRDERLHRDETRYEKELAPMTPFSDIETITGMSSRRDTYDDDFERQARSKFSSTFNRMEFAKFVTNVQNLKKTRSFLHRFEELARKRATAHERISLYFHTLICLYLRKSKSNRKRDLPQDIETEEVTRELSDAMFDHYRQLPVPRQNLKIKHLIEWIHNKHLLDLYASSDDEGGYSRGVQRRHEQYTNE